MTEPDWHLWRAFLAVLPSLLARFRAAHPAVDIELSLSDRTEDLLRRDADLAVRNVAPTQAALVARRIGEARSACSPIATTPGSMACPQHPRSFRCIP